jgi:hypothetical protein
MTSQNSDISLGHNAFLSAPVHLELASVFVTLVITRKMKSWSRQFRFIPSPNPLVGPTTMGKILSLSDITLIHTHPQRYRWSSALHKAKQEASRQ